MARRRSRQPLVPGSGTSLDYFKATVMQKKGYAVNPNEPNNVKFAVAKSIGVPLQQGYNGHLSTEDAGKIGGEIGGAMVREMIRMAQESLVRQGSQPPG